MVEKNNNLLVVAGIAALFLLSGRESTSGGVSGSGGKSTAITGVTPEQPTLPAPYQPPAPQPQYYQPEVGEPIFDLGYPLYPLSKKSTGRLWSQSPDVSNVLDTIKKQDATVYVSKKASDPRMVEYYVEIGGNTGIKPTSEPKKSSGGIVRNTPVKNIAQEGSMGGF